ncbi:rCG31948 [Rattus norvegicus]|uniref:RCG31948 n=1 Tax=Rattus norvegicus TaxID=10116 RepID=A6KDT0_RAT|nr:rCG31948 [Rattus norvegicus]
MGFGQLSHPPSSTMFLRAPLPFQAELSIFRVYAAFSLGLSVEQKSVSFCLCVSVVHV